MKSTFCIGAVCLLVVSGCAGTTTIEARPLEVIRPDYDPDVHDADPVKEFGSERGEPIDSGFFFHNCRYVEGPYVVERRGLATYINGIKIIDNLEWPPFDETVDEDPGAPPTGASPTDPLPAGVDWRNGHWSRKWRYLRQHHRFDVAFGKMAETFRACKQLRSVRVDGARCAITVVDRSGRRLPMRYSGCYHPLPLKRGEVLARAEYQKHQCEESLRARCFIGFNSGFASEIGGDDVVLPMMAVLNSDRTVDEKVEAMNQIRFLEVRDEQSLRTIRQFTHSRELAEKIKRMRAK